MTSIFRIVLVICTVVFSSFLQAEKEITIATFNIQTFGKTKSGKPQVMAALATIVRKYDIVAVQEFKDSSRAEVSMRRGLRVLHQESLSNQDNASRSISDNCYDNAFMKSCFGTVKTEMPLKPYENLRIARKEIPTYIRYYNTRRRHSSLGYMTPEAFEEAFLNQ